MSERAHLRFLPERLRERVRSDSDPREPTSGEFVLYWMRTGVRAHENPALDVALAAARERDIPVFVYHAVSEAHPYASDRIHTFILEGARSVAAELH
ncbi:MAG: deoxyribodipyrimidine photo-lyase, partial [Myxococcota bacterium]